MPALTPDAPAHGQYDIRPDHHEGLGDSAHHSWTSTSCQEILNFKPEPHVAIEGGTAVADAVQKLIKNKVTVAPVLAHDSGSLVGFLDYRDIVAYLLAVLSGQTGTASPHGDPKKSHISGADYDLEVHGLVRTSGGLLPKVAKQNATRAAFDSEGTGHIPVQELCNFSGRNPLYTVLPETTVLQVCETLASGIHRVAVVDGFGHYRGTLTQQRVVKFIKDHASQFLSSSPLLSLPLLHSDLNLATSATPVVTVSSDTRVIDALKLMNDTGHALPIIEAGSGRCVGTLSHVDIRWIFKEARWSLLWETSLFFCSMADQLLGIEEGKDRYPVFDVSPNSTFGFTIGKLVATGAKRVWVIDAGVPSSPHISGPNATFFNSQPTSPVPASPKLHPSHGAGAAAAGATLPGAGPGTGKITGVVALCDVLRVLLPAAEPADGGKQACS